MACDFCECVFHLTCIPSFRPVVFLWPLREDSIYKHFRAVPAAAGIAAPAGKQAYTFHDLRRAFATMNVDRLSAPTLQQLMRHKNHATTQVYINIARWLNEAVDSLYVPDLNAKPKGRTAGK